jgi:hypothetical protein
MRGFTMRDSEVLNRTRPAWRWRSCRWAAAVTLITALFVTASSAAYSPGSYRGSTNRNDPVKFRVEGLSVKRFAISLRYRCTDGDHYRTTDSFPTMKIGNGSFGGRFPEVHGAGSWRVSAHLGEPGATGSVAGYVRYNRRNRVDRHGSIYCRTGTVTFTANPQTAAEQPSQPQQPPPPSPQPPPVDWTRVIIGRWFQQIPPMSADLWFFNDNPTAGFRTGSRSFCPYANECGLSPAPAAFIWVVQGGRLKIEFYGGITYTEYQILGYNSATKTLTLSYKGVPTELVRF